MKRNMDLVRELLLLVESHGLGLDTNEVTVTGYGRNEVEYHFMILFEAGLLAYAIDLSDHNTLVGHWAGVRLTWAGHDFVDAARKPEIWERAMRYIRKHVESATFDVLKGLLEEIARRHLEGINF